MLLWMLSRACADRQWRFWSLHWRRRGRGRQWDGHNCSWGPSEPPLTSSKLCFIINFIGVGHRGQNFYWRRRPPDSPLNRPADRRRGWAHRGERVPPGSERTIKVSQQSERNPWWPSRISRWTPSRTDSNLPLSNQVCFIPLADERGVCR